MPYQRRQNEESQKGQWQENKKKWNGKKNKKWNKKGNKKWNKPDNDDDDDDDVEDQMEDFFEDIMKCDNQKRCGRNGFLQELSSCICQSFWSRNSDPSGRLCQAIPKATRTNAVKVISMFMKGNGPAMPQNRTVLRQLGKMSHKWGTKFMKLLSTPFEKKDLEVG